MVRSTEDREKRLAELKKEVTKRGFDRHISLVPHVSELPTELQSPAVMALAESESIRRSLFSQNSAGLALRSQTSFIVYA
jgi:hypothetical protein